MNKTHYKLKCYETRKKSKALPQGLVLPVFSCSLMFSALFSTPAYSQGVVAGTDISNTVLVTYKINNTSQNPIESSPTGNSIPGLGNGQGTVFKVDRKVDLLVTGSTPADVHPGDTQAELTFTLLNEGNDEQVFDLALNSALSTDNFNANNCISTVTSVSGTPLAGVTLPTSGSIKLKADQQANIKVRCDIPLTASGTTMQPGDNSLLSLIATAVENSDGTSVNETTTSEISNVVDTVFADSNGSDDSSRDARHSARNQYQIITTSTPPTLAINKSIVRISDPQGGNTAVEGSEVTYKINISTAGVGTVNNVIVTDPTPANMTYKASSITLDNVGQSDLTNTDNSDYGVSTANTATINLGNIVAGMQHEIQITYIIN